jgi:hypothetical protein
VQHPERDTLERILAALGARYTERRDVLELFGYVMDTPLPDADEIRWAIEACQAEIHHAVIPAYLLDCAHRLLAWNPFVPQLFGETAIQKAPNGTDFVSMIRLLYDPHYGFTSLIANADVFFRAQMRAFRYEMQLFRGEAWHKTLIDELLHDCPLFEHYWNEAEREQGYPTAARPLFPIELSLPGTGTLQFRITSEPFAQDRRFRVIYFLPADSFTMQQCMLWLSQHETT